MWASKWILASIVIKMNVLDIILNHVKERMYFSPPDISPMKFTILALVRNLVRFFPFAYGSFGMIIGIILIVIAIYFLYVYRRENFDWRKYGILLILGAIPYIRYLVVHNHSYYCALFTYRAQIATVIAASLIAAEAVNFKLVMKK